MKYISLFIKIIIILCLTIGLSYLNIVQDLALTFFPNIQKEIYIFVFLSFILIMGETILKTDKSHLRCLVGVYSIFLILTLYFRTEYEDYKFTSEFYLRDWFQFFLKNKIVFVNILGNIILFMPLGFILKNTLNVSKMLTFLLGLGIIIILEWLQFLSKRGVLDIVDIFLNALGLIVGVLLSKERRQKNHAE